MKGYKNFLLRMHEVRDTLEQILQADDDLVLGAQTIGERSEMNSLQKKRATVRELEDAVTKAHAKKVARETALKQKNADLERLQPALPAGVIASFEMGSNRAYAPSTIFVPSVRTGRLMVPQKIGTLTADFEKEAARMAHHGYMEAVTELERARIDLSTFERELIQLRDRMECLSSL